MLWKKINLRKDLKKLIIIYHVFAVANRSNFHFCPPFACLQCKGWAIAMTLSVCLSVCLSAQNAELWRNGASDEKSARDQSCRVSWQLLGGTIGCDLRWSLRGDFRVKKQFGSTIFNLLYHCSLLTLFTFFSLSVRWACLHRENL